MHKANCWEAMGCERGPGGAKVHEKGVCPAATAHEIDGLHGGLNGGRACWGVMNTLCDGDVQLTYVAKLQKCIGCEFHRAVLAQEECVATPQEVIKAIESAGIVRTS